VRGFRILDLGLQIDGVPIINSQLSIVICGVISPEVRMKLRIFLLCFSLLFALQSLFAQKKADADIRKMIDNYMVDPRGPYKDIRWYCADGSYAEPKVGCASENKKNLQRARYKDEVDALGKTNHIYLGQILSKTGYSDFWDAANRQSRMKQYMLGRFLMAADNGWVLRRGQYYRGAFQVEDEEAWGIAFFEWLLAKDDAIKQNFFAIRQAAKDIPHSGDDSKTLEMRAISKNISEAYSPFMDLRIKIHGQPETKDIAAVKDFQVKHDAKLSADLKAQMKNLVKVMETVFAPVQMASLNKYLNKLPKESAMLAKINAFVTAQASTPVGAERAEAFAGMMWDIRENLLTEPKGRGRLALLDISNQLESIFFKEAGEWETKTLGEELKKVHALAWAAAAAGFIEKWEWEGTEFLIRPSTKSEMSLAELNRVLDISRAMVEWGTGQGRAAFSDVINLYSAFEPLAVGFLDDRIRSSVLLHLGYSVGKLGDFISNEAKLSNHVFDISDQSSIRGLNPGFAKGELIVVSGNENTSEVSADKIFVFNRPPSDLKPVAGIATVSEGNLVSHVQLLARNLGIPNMVLSLGNLEALQKFSGKQIFYAVSNKGTVVMKLADDMTAEEKKLFEKKVRKEDKISVPVEKLNLTQQKVVRITDVRSGDSGKLCGPKAANFGQLKSMFPDNVVDGFVIPFGIFRAHFDQKIPGGTQSYWEYLNAIFDRSEDMAAKGTSPMEVETFTLSELEKLRTFIKSMPLMPEFIQDLNDCFRESFGQEMGKVPVFLRSDTNMEDLKDFTGAGLNLTLFNVVDAEKILQGIKDVWASPYSERSYKWRQKYLNDPENVFPSILVIPSVDVDYSGVMVTKGIRTNNPNDITIAFSRGAGGAVDGQAAESFVLRGNGSTSLVSPAREPYYNSLPVLGGTQKNITSFEKPILKTTNLRTLREIAAEIKEKLPQAPGIETNGPWDVELGFKDDKLWLFQVRPFVENKNAMASEYLKSITPEIPESKMISLSSKL
jgi:rifampicin phosphotransferase